MSHPVLGKAASMLVDSNPLVVSNKFLIVVFQLPVMVEKANEIDNQNILENLIETIFKKRLFIYAVSRSDSIELQKQYMDLYALGKTPKSVEEDFNISEEE